MLCLIAFVTLYSFSMEELQFYSLPFRLFFYACHFALLYCYFRVGMCDPGVIVPNEENSIENKDRLESQDYHYCSICRVYCPPHSRHCDRCGVCVRNYDHHCAFMGWGSRRCFIA